MVYICTNIPPISSDLLSEFVTVLIRFPDGGWRVGALNVFHFSVAGRPHTVSRESSAIEIVSVCSAARVNNFYKG